MNLKELFADAPKGMPEGVTPEITDIVYDSRKVKPGCLFVCLRGAAVDGHDFAAKAAEQGAAAILADHVARSCFGGGEYQKSIGRSICCFFRSPGRGVDCNWFDRNKGKDNDSVDGSFYFAACRA